VGRRLAAAGRPGVAGARQGCRDSRPGCDERETRIQVTHMLLSYGLRSWQRAAQFDEYGATWSSPPWQVRSKLNSRW
jgi:hypothetical protein